MRKFSYRPYLLLAFFFLTLMSLPKSTSDKIRSFIVCSFAPSWQAFTLIKEKTLYLLNIPFHFSSKLSLEDETELQRLTQENLLLRAQIENVREWLLSEDRIQDQLQRYQTLSQVAKEESIWKDFFKRRSQELCRALEMQIQSIPARVVFREPASWSSILWINLGEKNNKKLGRKVVGKNSPVLLGVSIVGIVEYVGEHYSRVRLISDSRLVPSVRAVRGKEQNRYFLEHLDTLMFLLQNREDFFSSEEEATQLQQHLSRLKSVLLQRSGNLYLAKGEIQGTSNPLWRSRNQVLKGKGFNYDFADLEGPARDLRSGEPYEPTRKNESISLLKAGDLLVTTGLDGIFPPGFRVAVVSKVHTLKEGASSYDLEAISTAGNLDDLHQLFVLSPPEGSLDFLRN